LLLVAISVNSQNFDNLKKIKIGGQENVFLMYNSSMAYEFNTKLQDLDRADPLYPKEADSREDIKLIKTKIDQNSDVEYYIVFSENPSGDPHYMFYRDGQFESYETSISGYCLYIPGDGFLYSSGHINNNFDTRVKYVFKDNKISEVEQPYYYVGIESKTLQKVKMYYSSDLQKIVTTLEANTNIRILLNKKGTNIYLVVTEFGITGWIDNGYSGLMPTVLDKIFFRGD
jgi:hypothetical protein